MKQGWVSRTVIGIVIATFFSDVGHEMVTAVLPMYLTSVGLGAAALGVMEGLADLLFSLSKLAGGFVGHHTSKKKPWATFGYALTTIGTGCIAFVGSVAGLISLRAAAWFGRGFRSPLRDFLLADAVGPTHFGRAYGIERAADMLGAVAGPLLATLLLWFRVDLRTLILISIIPSALSVASIAFGTRDEPAPKAADGRSVEAPRRKLPKVFWLFLIGVALFGLGDFSRTFLILLASKALSQAGGHEVGVGSTAVMLYALHNAASALAAYPVGRLGDSHPKLDVLLVGYLLGVVTNATLAFYAGSLLWLVPTILMSGIYIAIEETIEKATAAELLPRELRSLGFGILACANALGDMVSSLYVGLMLDAGHATMAFAIPALVGFLGIVWLAVAVRRV